MGSVAGTVCMYTEQEEILISKRDLYVQLDVWDNYSGILQVPIRKSLVRKSIGWQKRACCILGP